MFTVRIRRLDIGMGDQQRDETWEVPEKMTVGEFAELVIAQQFLAVADPGIRWNLTTDDRRGGAAEFAVIEYEPWHPGSDQNAVVLETEPGSLVRRLVELPIVGRDGVATLWLQPPATHREEPLPPVD